jgi:CRP-like cAMP-binding protein
VADEKIDRLRSVSLFSALRDRELKQIATLADEVDLPEGKVLIRQGEWGAEMFVLISGEAIVDRDGVEVARAGPGTVIGEIALLSEGPRTATVTLTEPSRLFVLAHREFHALMDSVPEVRTCVLDELARRLRRLEEDKAH